MKRLSWTATALSVLGLAASAGAQGPREADWKAVDEAIAKGLPKSAIERLQPIAEAALKEQAYPEAIRAIATQVAMEGQIQGQRAEERVLRLQQAIATAPEPMRPVMQAILANWYWGYFQQNRWRLLQRTRTAEPPGDDLATWDLPRVLAAIDAQFTQALAGAEALKATPVAAYDALFEKGGMPDACRPTVFDLVAYDALDYYSAGEQAGAKAEDAFVLEADGPIFDAVDAFLKWDPAATETPSPTVKAIRLYQALLTFHRADADPAARLDADLQRLAFGQNTAFGETKLARYTAALERFAATHAGTPAAARALAMQAESVSGDDPAQAHALALRGRAAATPGAGATLCSNLVLRLEAPAMYVTTERVWSSPPSEIVVSYRNVNRIYFRAVAADFGARVTSKDAWRNPFDVDHDQFPGLLKATPVLAWSADLPPTPDFRERTERLAAPKGLKPGFYCLLASQRPDFAEKNNQLVGTAFWVSDLALIVRSRTDAGAVEGFVLQAESGEPLAGAEVGGWKRSRDKRERFAAVKSDAEGFFRLEGLSGAAYLLLANHAGQQAASLSDNWIHQAGAPKWPQQRTIFFTDRALYRPGQTVGFKGICFTYDQPNSRYATLAGADVTVLFSDPNGKEVSRLTLRANDYGSFSGSFTAPRDRLAGRYTLRATDGPSGSAGVTVEEYKRPKFQVTLNAPADQARLGGEVTVQGQAKTYTGMAVGGAPVKYRVVREVRFPPWCWWFRGGYGPGMLPGRESQEIAHGVARTTADGAFELRFVARPDPAADPKDEPVFHFTVHADVTDSTGETRTASRSVPLGFTALQAVIEADEWQTSARPVRLTVRTQTHAGDGCAAEGTIKVHALRAPEKVVRAPLSSGYPYFPVAARHSRASARDAGLAGAGSDEPPDLSDLNNWELGEVAISRAFKTAKDGRETLSIELPAGAYRVMLESRDAFGKAVTARLAVVVIDEQSNTFGVRIPNWVGAPSWSLATGTTFRAAWGSGYGAARAFIEIEHQGRTLQRFWTPVGRTQAIASQEVTEALRGGFVYRVTAVRENRAYLTSRVVDVPWTNQQLTVTWERFVSKLGPAQRETWTAVITGADAKRASAEMVATLYDASLDAYLPNNWPATFGVFRSDHDSAGLAQFMNALAALAVYKDDTQPTLRGVDLSYRRLPPVLAGFGHGIPWGEVTRLDTIGGMRRSAGRGMAMAMSLDSVAPAAAFAGDARADGNAMTADGMANRESGLQRKRATDKGGAGGEDQTTGPELDLGQVQARANLQESAFFFPHLLADSNGVVRMEFTMPEALTEWRLLAFAHDRQLRAGLLQDRVVTSKDLMVEPNPPRFVREGDTIEFTVKVSNKGSVALKGTVRLALADARTLVAVNRALGNTSPDQAFALAAGESRSLAWRLRVPDGAGFLTYKAVAAAGALSDGESGWLPVLSRRVLLTESLPLPIRGAQSRTFAFDRLLQSGKSDTLRHQSLCLQMVSQPAWYAVMALPYLIETPHEGSEQSFNRLYANALAQHIANANPKIRRIFDLWRGTAALDSPLEKNEDLKSVMLEETPWYRQAMDEKQARQNVGVLFEANRLADELQRVQAKLVEMQYGNGLWPWFPGGQPSEVTSLYIVAGYGRLRHLGAAIDVAPAVKALSGLDAWVEKSYREILRDGHPDANHLTPTIAYYFYGRSFFLKDQPVDKAHQEAWDYFLGQARRYWSEVGDRQSQAHLAIALKRLGDAATPAAILASLREHAVMNEEMGMFWRDTELSWWWYRAPIETQVMMVEVFSEVANDAAAVEACQVWLLKQKQTQDWKTTKATADAVYALLMGGADLLASDALVEVDLGGAKIVPQSVEAGTGFYEQRFGPAEIAPRMGNATLTKRDAGVAWGSLHWQYFEDLAKVTPYAGTPLTLRKQIFVRENTKQGPQLRPVRGVLAVGDELVVRVELRSDRDMEYLHLKDARGSGTEPVNVLSGYRHQDGLGYYESTRDTASHFYIDFLPKGTYVFEYATRVVHRGVYQTGVAEIQCLYAPEFNSHSESFELQVK